MNFSDLAGHLWLRDAFPKPLYSSSVGGGQKKKAKLKIKRGHPFGPIVEFSE